MVAAALRALKFGRNWATSGRGVRTLEIEVDRGPDMVPATLYLPSRAARALPGWVVLHGITVPGRRHEVLVRFARALAGSGAAVLTPEIPEWTDLRLEPEPSVATIRAAALALAQRGETAPDRIGLMGFSFGAPQAVIASTDPRLEGKLRLVAGFGGYCDLRRLLRFMFTGEHEWEGVDYYIRPDPYARWIVGANYLTRVPRYREFEPTSLALRHLALEAGQRRLASWDPRYDGVKLELRSGLPAEQRPVYDLFAPLAEESPDRDAAFELVDQLLEAMHGASALLEPVGFLDRVTSPVRLIHGVGDHLIPYTESLRLAQAFEGHARVSVTLTGLFGHSSAQDGHGLWARARHALALGVELTKMFGAV